MVEQQQQKTNCGITHFLITPLFTHQSQQAERVTERGNEARWESHDLQFSWPLRLEPGKDRRNTLISWASLLKKLKWCWARVGTHRAEGSAGLRATSCPAGSTSAASWEERRLWRLLLLWGHAPGGRRHFSGVAVERPALWKAETTIGSLSRHCGHTGRGAGQVMAAMLETGNNAWAASYLLRKWLAFLRGHWTQLLCSVCLGSGGGMSDICLSAPDPLCVSTGSGGPLLMAAWEVPPSLSPTFPQRASLPSHSAYLSAFPLAPPRGLFSHSPSLDLLPFLTRAWSGEDWIFFWITGLSGSPCNALPPLPSRESPFSHPSRPSPCLPLQPGLSLLPSLPCPLVAEIYSSQNTSHVCDFANALVPFPLSFSDEFLPIHHNSVEASILQHPPLSSPHWAALPLGPLAFLSQTLLPCFSPPQADRWLHGGRPSACCLVNDQKTLVKWLIGWKRTS